MKRLTASAAVLTLALALVPASVAGTPATRTVTIGDNFYAPTKMTVRVGTTVRWKWPDDTGDSHDVKLGSAPKAARRFHSEEAGSAYSFKRKLTIPGTYKIICTLHEEMRQTIVVKR